LSVVACAVPAIKRQNKNEKMQHRRRDSTLILPVVIETVIASSPPNHTQHVVAMVR
jgi:hypothetical protein